MLVAGIIEHSSSDWCTLIAPVKKKDGTLRLCVDYRIQEAERSFRVGCLPNASGG